MIAWTLWLQAPPAGESLGIEWWRALLALVLVASLLAALVVLMRRGALGALVRSKHAAIRIETVVPIGDRRALMIVAVEGRRLLLGASPVNVTLVTELGAKPPFEAALAGSIAQTGATPQ